MKTYSVPVLVVFFITLLNLDPASGRRKKNKKGGDEGTRPAPKLLRLACELNFANGTVRHKHCGCDDEEAVACDVGPIALPRYDVTSAMYCNTPVDMRTNNPYKGVLKSACLIKGAGDEADQMFKYHPCKHTEEGEEVPCELGPLPLVINGVNAHAYFCEKTSKINMEKIVDDSTCVKLEPGSGGGGRKGKKEKIKKKGKKEKKKKGRKGDKGKKSGKKEKGGRKRKNRAEGDGLE